MYRQTAKQQTGMSESRLHFDDSTLASTAFPLIDRMP
jgi:hypothetical protein